jgi:regulator of replication initiation timing
MIENINFTYRIFLLLFSILLAVFLTSKIWLPSDVSIQNTAIGTTLTTESVGVRLQSWQYNPSTHFMEAAFTYQNSDNLQNIKFIPIAHVDTNKALSLSVTVPYEHNGYLVIQIQNVPQNWNVVSLWIDSQQEQTVDLTQNDSGVESPSSDTKATMQQGANFFCDVRKVVRNSSLKSQSSLYYSLKSVDNEISTVQSHMAQTNKKITAANLSIQQLTSDISVLNDNEKYQTADEVKQSKDAIQSKTAQISDLKNSIAQFQSDIKDDQLKLKKLRQKWNDTRDGKYKDTSGSATKAAPASSSSPSSKSSVSSSGKVTVD